ncbi:PREDICTED: uncharacterized protein LOC105560766 isoform X2 [Vollenhovia emeryi]|uniref:uncharacterized protein LOC105560766 isoform X2 n=1 Tax=Vollenhovia emeryi TaxID=411798 RepID=UPI0005F3ECC1|nr:PREDICTED: uncharacterized protein LOC105560766 isoform X2 [Vollenhovia emeryi]
MQTSVVVSGQQKLVDCKASIYGEEYCHYRTDLLKIFRAADPKYLAKLKAARTEDYLTGRLASEFLPVVQKAQWKFNAIKRSLLFRLQYITDVVSMAEFMDLSTDAFLLKDLDKMFFSI